MESKIQFIEKCIKEKSSEIGNLIENVTGVNISTTNYTILEKEKNNFIDGAKFSLESKEIILTTCSKNEANKIGYQYWAYFCNKNAIEKNIKLLDKIEMKAYSAGKNHDIMEINKDEIKIKLHFVPISIFNKEELSQNELFVIIVA